MTASEESDVDPSPENTEDAHPVVRKLDSLANRVQNLTEEGIAWFTPERMAVFSKVVKVILFVAFVAAILYWSAAFFLGIEWFEF